MRRSPGCSETNVVKPRAGQPWIEDVADAVAAQIEGEPSNRSLEARITLPLNGIQVIAIASIEIARPRLKGYGLPHPPSGPRQSEKG
jgi:hypothetical protein